MTTKYFGDLINATILAYGERSLIMPYDNFSVTLLDRIPTGIDGLDAIMGGGIPVNHLMTVLGQHSCFKSSFALYVVGAFQRTCRHCKQPLAVLDFVTGILIPVNCCTYREPMLVVWLDADQCLESAWASKCHVEVDRLLVLHPNSAGQAIDMVDRVIRTGLVDLVVIDSLYALVDDSAYNDTRSKVLSGAVSLWLAAKAQHNCTIIGIDPFKKGLGSTRSDKAYPDDNAFPCHSSVILEFASRGFPIPTDTGDVRVPYEAFTDKNTTSKPGEWCPFNFYLDGHKVLS